MCDACSQHLIAIEGNTMDLERRVKCDDKNGGWKVIFNGKTVKADRPLKTHTDAYQYLQELITGKKTPTYE